MINKENLETLAESSIKQEVITTKELSEIGFNSHDINKLIESKKIERIKRGGYKYTSLKDLNEYARELIKQGRLNESHLCYLKCYELDKSDINTNLHLLLNCINTKDYYEAFKFLNYLTSTNNPFYICDYNLYIYLISFIARVPKMYHDLIENISLDDVLVINNDNRYYDKNEINTIRTLILDNKFFAATKKLNDYLSKQNKLNIFNVILKTLLYQNLENINNSKKTIIDYINNKKWFELKKYIDKNPKVFELYLTDYSKQLLDAIITITTTKKDIVPERNNTSTFNEAMEANNYKEALQFNRVFCDNKNINKEENLIYILLHVVCNLNDEYEAKEKIEPKKETKNISNSLDLDVMIQIVESLLKTDLCNAFKSIRLYLDATNKREYEFLIVNLVKISVINNDNSYNESLAELNKLKDNNYKIDIAKYIGKYYLSLTVNSFEEAKLYLDIIKQASIIYKYDLNIINMEEELNQKINVFETLKNEKNITEDRGAQAEEEIEEVTESRESLIAENIATPKEEQKVSTSKLIKNKYNYVQDINLEEYIAKKYELLKKSPGIVILKKMPYERRLAIYSIIRNYPDVQAFSLYSPTEEKKSVVLKYQPRAKEQFNIREIAKEGDDAFKARDYNKCIECYKELLNINYPKSFVFAKLGLSYLKLKKKQIALDFITVAHCLSMENENGLYDFTDLIAKLRGEEVDRKPYSKVDSQEFISNEMDNYYGIDNFVEISNYIMENNLNIISAWKSLGMSEEQLDIIKLLYAREYYSAGYYDKGDEFIKLYEKSTYKTNFTITLSEKIRKEKRFFVHKEKEQTIKLSLTIKP